MYSYPKYVVKDNEAFDADHYPQVVNDITKVCEGSVDIKNLFKIDILTSFTKNHSLKLEWLRANPLFADLITSGSLPTKNIEALFEASLKNTLFSQQLELFIKSRCDSSLPE